jgi:membrane-associated phospholipid phosphatase
MPTNIHWFSDAVAGALIGYPIGSVVGSSYRNLLKSKSKQNSWNFNIVPSGILFSYNF